MPLKLTRRHGSPFWYIRGTIRGVIVDESTGLSDRAAAEEVLALRAAEVVTESVHGSSAVRTFSDAALSYMEGGGERKHLAPILKRLGEKKVGKIGQAEIEAAAMALFPRAGPATRNRRVFTPISAVLHHAARLGWCGKPVIARPAQPKGRVRWVTYDEAERLIDAAAPHLKPLVIFLLTTGARVSEALYLDWRDVDLSAAHVSFAPTDARGIKNDEARGVPLHARTVAALANLPHRTGMVFRRPVGRAQDRPKPGAKVGLPYESRGGKGGGQLKTAWAGMCRRAGISNFTPHDCRHTWATWHYKANRDLLALQQLGGWKDLKMVERYAHVNTAQLAPSINRLWGNCGDQQNEAAINVLQIKA